MQYFTFEQVSDGGQVDVRVRPDVYALTGWKLYRAHMIEEDPGADHGHPGAWQYPTHGESPQVAFPWGDNHVYGRLAAAVFECHQCLSLHGNALPISSLTALSCSCCSDCGCWSAYVTNTAASCPPVMS